MTRGSPNRWLGALVDLPAIALASFALALLLHGFRQRVGFPYDLEWMEGGMLAQARHVMAGGGIYVEPSVEYIPFIYPPLYTWVLAGLGKVFGLSYALGRSVSLVGTLAATAALVAAVRGEGRGWALAVGGAGLYLSAYEDVGTFYDLVRIDGLFMACLTWSLVALRHGWLRTGGILLVLSFATKHNAAAFGLPALVWILRVHGRTAALRFFLWSVVPAAAFTGAMLFEGDGLFLTYLLAVPGHHPFVAERLFPGVEKELLASMPWTLGIAAVVGLAWSRRWTRGGAWWLSQGALAMVLTAIMRGHHGGFLNVLMPGAWTAALWSALALGAVVSRWPRLEVRFAASALVAWQIWAGRWPVDRFVPTAADLGAGDELVARLAAIEGEVLAPWSPWYLELAGKQPGFHLIALWDLDHEGGPLRDRVEVVRRSFAEQRWAAVLTANDRLGYGLEKHYDKAETLRWKGQVLYPKTGWRVRPRFLYEPRAGR